MPEVKELARLQNLLNYQLNKSIKWRNLANETQKKINEIAKKLLKE